jgi:hypothetical protein
MDAQEPHAKKLVVGILVVVLIVIGVWAWKTKAPQKQAFTVAPSGQTVGGFPDYLKLTNATLVSSAETIDQSGQTVSTIEYKSELSPDQATIAYADILKKNGFVVAGPTSQSPTSSFVIGISSATSTPRATVTVSADFVSNNTFITINHVAK